MSGAEDVSGEDLLALIVELRAVNTALHARVIEQDERIALQDNRIAVQGERIAQLERALSRNSGNSSMLPSGDDTLGRTPPVGRAGAAVRRAFQSSLRHIPFKTRLKPARGQVITRLPLGLRA